MVTTRSWRSWNPLASLLFLQSSFCSIFSILTIGRFEISKVCVFWAIIMWRWMYIYLFLEFCCRCWWCTEICCNKWNIVSRRHHKFARWTILSNSREALKCTNLPYLKEYSSLILLDINRIEFRGHGEQVYMKVACCYISLRKIWIFPSSMLEPNFQIWVFIEVMIWFCLRNELSSSSLLGPNNWI